MQIELYDIENLDCPVCGSSLILEKTEDTSHSLKCSDEHRWGCGIEVNLKGLTVVAELSTE